MCTSVSALLTLLLSMLLLFKTIVHCLCFYAADDDPKNPIRHRWAAVRVHICILMGTLLVNHIESLKVYLPVRVSAFRICHPPGFFRIIFPVMKMLMGAKLRKRVKPHFGKDAEVLKILEEEYRYIYSRCSCEGYVSFTFTNSFSCIDRIPKTVLPTDLGGELVLDQEKWLQNREEAGL